MDENHENFNKNVQLIEKCGVLITLYTSTYKVEMEALDGSIELATPGLIKEGK